MSNVFLQNRSQFIFKVEPLKKIIAAQPNKQVSQVLESFYSEKHQKPIQYAYFLKDLLTHVTLKDTIQKVLHLLVYLSTLLPADQAIKLLDQISKVQLQPYLLVKFFSYVFKSVHDQKLKKWIISSSLEAMQRQEKVSSFTSFVENFDLIIKTLVFQDDQILNVYWKLVNYLQKHIIYKKLVSHYVFVALGLVNKTNQNSDIVTKFLIRAISCDNFNDTSIDLLNSEALKSHQLFTILQARMTGDISALQSIKIWEKYQLEKNKIQRKVKIEAIPRLFKSIKQASYTQAAQMLKIQKKQVQGYIIEAVRLGIMKAKLDEYQQTIIINKLNLRCLQKSQQVQLQKDISDLCQNLNKAL